VTDLRTEPDPPLRGPELRFVVTFANTTIGPVDLRWIVYIYRPDNPKTSFGETTITSSQVQVGAYDVKSLGYWRLPLGGPCENFVARVAAIDQNNKAFHLLRPDGQTFEKNLTVCAQAEVPPTPPLTGIQPPTTPTPGGLYVTDVRTEPSPPMRGTDLVFYATFLNNTGTLQNYKWIVYIFKPDNMARSFGETTATTSPLPPGSSEQKSLGYWRLALGGPCEPIIVRVSFFDQSNRPVPFMKPDGQMFQKDINICP
jgi:hypothetical protein